MAVNNMPLRIGEILNQIKEAKSKAERVAILKANDEYALRHFLRLAYDPKLKMSLREGRPAFTPNPKPNGFGDTTIKTAIKGWYVFFENSAPGLRQSKRELLFVNLLENLDKQEAEFLIDAKDKKLNIGLTKKVIDEVFPGLLSSDVKEVSSNPEEEKGDETTNTAQSNN